MPITLNGTYWTMEEAAQLLGKTHSITCRWIKRSGMQPFKLGGSYLLDESDMEQLQKISEHLETYRTCLTLKGAATVFKVPYARLEDEVNCGYIPYESDFLGKKRLTSETVEVIRKSGFLDRKKTNWSSIRELFKSEEE